jgi:hypothetical protein
VEGSPVLPTHLEVVVVGEYEYGMNESTQNGKGFSSLKKTVNKK